MKLTNANRTAFVKKQLATNPQWAVKALVRIYTENQTVEEKAIDQTKEDNGIGFTGVDGNFLSSLAKQFVAKNFLSEKQMVFVMKKMPKYHAQVIKMSNLASLNKMVEDFEYNSACETEEGIRNELRAHGAPGT